MLNDKRTVRSNGQSFFYGIVLFKVSFESGVNFNKFIDSLIIGFEFTFKDLECSVKEIQEYIP